MLSWIVNVSSRLNSWNTKPRLSRRKVATSLSFILPSSLPSSTTVPPVGLSSAARRFKSVVLPEPDSPIMATYSPSSTLKFTFLSASTWFPPKRVLYTFLRFSTVKMLIVFYLHRIYTLILPRFLPGNHRFCLHFPIHFLHSRHIFSGELTHLRIRILR